MRNCAKSFFSHDVLQGWRSRQEGGGKDTAAAGYATCGSKANVSENKNSLRVQPCETFFQLVCRKDDKADCEKMLPEQDVPDTKAKM